MSSVRGFLAACLGRMALAPLTLCVPRDPSLVVVVGRSGGAFLDNCKHYFVSATQRHAGSASGKTPIFLSESTEQQHSIRSLGGQAERLSSLRGLWHCLRASTLIVDSLDWSQCGRVGAFRGARIVQLWHGIPLKSIELALYRKQRASTMVLLRPLLSVYKWIIARYPRFDLLLSTSEFMKEKVFLPSFKTRSIASVGYPRNDVLLCAQNDLHPMIWLNTDSAAREAIIESKAAGRGVLLYAPTFRKDMRNPFDSGEVQLSRLSAMAQKRNLLVLIKLHPWMHGRVGICSLPGLYIIAPSSDIYPLLRDVDVLVTDYSSLYFDYLLLDRPIVFFPYDLKHYTTQDRNLLFNYDEMTPGPKVYTLEQLDIILEGKHKDQRWSEARARVRHLAFDHIDSGAATRLENVLRQMGLS